MDYKGLVALVLAVSIGLFMVVGVAGLAITGRPLSDVGGEAVIAIGGALVGALATYLGMKDNH